MFAGMDPDVDSSVDVEGRDNVVIVKEEESEERISVKGFKKLVRMDALKESIATRELQNIIHSHETGEFNNNNNNNNEERKKKRSLNGGGGGGGGGDSDDGPVSMWEGLPFVPFAPHEDERIPVKAIQKLLPDIMDNSNNKEPGDKQHMNYNNRRHSVPGEDEKAYARLKKILRTSGDTSACSCSAPPIEHTRDCEEKSRKGHQHSYSNRDDVIPKEKLNSGSPTENDSDSDEMASMQRLHAMMRPRHSYSAEESVELHTVEEEVDEQTTLHSPKKVRKKVSVYAMDVKKKISSREVTKIFPADSHNHKSTKEDTLTNAEDLKPKKRHKPTRKTSPVRGVRESKIDKAPGEKETRKFNRAVKPAYNANATDESSSPNEPMSLENPEEEEDEDMTEATMSAKELQNLIEKRTHEKRTELVEKFVSALTLHGYAQFYEATGFRKVLWGLILAAMAVFIVRLTYLSYRSENYYKQVRRDFKNTVQILYLVDSYFWFKKKSNFTVYLPIPMR